MEPDESIRLRAWRFDPAAAQTLLSEKERERIIAAIVARGPALIAGARRVSFLSRSGLLLSVAAALLFFFWPAGSEPAQPANPIAVLPTPECSRDDFAVTPSFVEEGEGRSRLRVAQRAEVVLEAGTYARVVSVAACSTRLQIDLGHLTVHARDLGGGELIVSSRGSEVVVRGTLFSVDVHDDVLRVAVEHGRVSVLKSGAELTSVSRGEAVVIRDGAVQREAISPEQQQALRDAVAVRETPSEQGILVAPAPRAPTPATKKATARASALPEPTTAELVMEAEQLWQNGKRDAARARFQQAGARTDATAEAAWLRFSRLELTQGSPQRALSALKQRNERFGSGLLAAEASWLEVQALERLLRHAEARAVAEHLGVRFPNSPQARAARGLVQSQEMQ